MNDTIERKRTLTPIERDSDRARAVWAHLEEHLSKNQLAHESGEKIRCDPADFMLMGERADGAVMFKNVWTRAYLNFDARGQVFRRTEAVYESTARIKEREAQQNREAIAATARDGMQAQAALQALRAGTDDEARSIERAFLNDLPKVSDEVIGKVKQRGGKVEPLRTNGQTFWVARMDTDQIVPEKFATPSHAWIDLAERMAITKVGEVVMTSREFRSGGVRIDGIGPQTQRLTRYEIRDMGKEGFGVFAVVALQVGNLKSDLWQSRVETCREFGEAARVIGEEIGVQLQRGHDPPAKQVVREVGRGR